MNHNIKSKFKTIWSMLHHMINLYLSRYNAMLSYASHIILFGLLINILNEISLI